jgi:hypothetical protein
MRSTPSSNPQADPLGVSDEGFGESLAGETISHAYDAFWESLTDLPRGHNPAVVTAIERQLTIVRMTMEHAVRQMEAIDPQQVLTETLETPIETPTAWRDIWTVAHRRNRSNLPDAARAALVRRCPDARPVVENRQPHEPHRQLSSRPEEDEPLPGRRLQPVRGPARGDRAAGGHRPAQARLHRSGGAMSPAIGMQLSRTGAKALFFDRRTVQDAMDRTTRRVFARYGAVTRLDAKRSLRKRRSGAPSPPGQPPRSRTGLLRRSIYYAADLRKRSVVIGPVRLSKGDDVPELHEYGGTAKRRFVLQAQPAHGESSSRATAPTPNPAPSATNHARSWDRPRSVRKSACPSSGPRPGRGTDRCPHPEPFEPARPSSSSTPMTRSWCAD